MEEVLLRFHLIGRQIFETLDNESFSKCRIVNRSWKTFVDDLKSAWIRKIRFCSLGSNEPLEEILKCTKLEVVKELANVAMDFCTERCFADFDLARRNSGHILHFAAMIGYEEFFKENNLRKFNEKYSEICVDEWGNNPDDKEGYTPLHFAAEAGHFSVSQLIIENHKAENPNRDIFELKSEDFPPYFQHPLWAAMYEKHLDICKLIIENLIDKNPQYSEKGETALHEFARIGHLEICELIIKNIRKDFHPADDKGRTPFHLAASRGHLSICKLMIEHFDDKNPIDMKWLTPLHIAAKKGDWAICKLIVDKFKDSPIGLWGTNPLFQESPYEKALAMGHSSVCLLFILNH